MSIEIQSLTIGAPTPDSSSSAQNDYFNVIENANTVYTLYAAAKSTAINKAAIVKSIRLVNTHASSAVKITLWFCRLNANGEFRRRLLAPAEITLPAGFSFIDDSEITLEPGDKIQARADTANVVQYLISGLERDVI